MVMNKWFYDISMSLLIGSVAISILSLIIAICHRIYTNPLAVLFFISFLACTTAIGYIIRYYALKNK
jgi:hypothetical protein